MPNRSREENTSILMVAFKKAGKIGLSVDDAKEILFGDDTSKKNATKKVLEEMRSKGLIKTDSLKNKYVITSEG
jgi:predicted transcriptional regulator